jgi:hypothetical protein
VRLYAGNITPTETPRITQDCRADQRTYLAAAAEFHARKHAKTLCPENRAAGEAVLSGGHW